MYDVVVVGRRGWVSPTVPSDVCRQQDVIEDPVGGNYSTHRKVDVIGAQIIGRVCDACTMLSKVKWVCASLRWGWGCTVTNSEKNNHYKFVFM